MELDLTMYREEKERFRGCLYRSPTPPNRTVPRALRPGKVTFIVKDGERVQKSEEERFFLSLS